MITGLSETDIAAIGREIEQHGPAVAIADEGLGGEAEEAIHALNIVLNGNAIVPRGELPAPYADEALAPAQEIDRLADRSVSLLLIDASAGDATFPWPLVQRKLQPKALVVALAPFFGGIVQNAAYIVPTLPVFESFAEMPAPADVPAAQLTIAAPLLPPRKEAFDPAAFIRAIARTSGSDLPGEWTKSEELMRARVAAIHAKREGTVTSLADDSTKAVSEFGSADEMWEALIGGGRWEGERARPMNVSRVSSPALAIAAMRGRRDSLSLVLRTPRDITASAAVSPVMTKLYQESGLRRAAQTAVLNPATARQLGLAESNKARLETGAGSIRVTIATDHSVMPGVVEITAAPDGIALGEIKAASSRTVFDIVSPGVNGSWRSVEARLVAEA